jgi:MFS transporter, PPP family, 3-phenylpropionic acid transporter
MRSLKLFYFAYLAALGAFSPYFGPFLEARGFSAWQLSMLMSLWYATRALAPNLWNAGVARSTDPIQWLRYGAVGTLLSCACFLPHWPFWGMVLVMLIFASLYNALMPQYEALTLAHLHGETERYSGIRVYGSVGFLVVVLSFGALFRAVGADYLIAAMLPLVALLVWASFLSAYPTGGSSLAPQQLTQPRAQPAPNQVPPLKRVLKPSIVALVFVGFCNQIAHGPLYVYFSVFLLRHGFDAFQVGALWSLGVGCEIIAFTQMRQILLRVRTAPLVAFCLLAGALRWASTGYWPDSGWVIAIAQMAHALTFAALHAAIMQVIARDVATEDLGYAQALFYSVASGLGGVASALIAGVLWTNIGDQACFYAAAGFSLLALLAVPWLTPRI